MQQQELQAFDRPGATVLKMFTDRRYFERKCALLGYTASEILSYEHDQRSARTRLRYRTEPRLPLPEFARRFVPDMQTVTEEHYWDVLLWRGQLLIEVAGLPVRIRVEMAVEDIGKGSRNCLDWDLRCAVPLIGGKLEHLLMTELLARSAADHLASRQLLVDY